MTANIFDKQINIREVETLIRFAQRRKRSVMIFGGPGIGKSDKIKQAANALFGERVDNVVDLRLSDKEPSDVVGIPMGVTDPVTKEVRTVFATPSFWPTDPEWEGIIFLDELTNAYPILQQAAYQIMLDRRIGDYVFPKGCVFAGAGNRDGDGGATSVLLAPLANRMVIVEIEYNAGIWLTDFAIPTGIHSSVVGLVKAMPDAIYTYEQSLKSGSISFSTPRSLATASEILFDLDEGFIDERTAGVYLQGTIGKGLDNELMTYHTRAKELPAIADIMEGVTKKHSLSSDKVDLLFVIGTQGTNYLRKEMKDLSVSDDTVLRHTANFMSFLQNNYIETNNDFVTSVFLSLLQKTGLGEAVLLGTHREKMPPRLMAAYPEVQSIVLAYHKDYNALVSEGEKDK